MFKNIGNKIKNLATIVTIFGIIISIVSSIILWTSGYDDFIIRGFVVFFGGILVSWISSFILYGFGQLIEDTSLIREHLSYETKKENDNKIILKEEKIITKNIDKKETKDSNLNVDHKNINNSMDKEEFANECDIVLLCDIDDDLKKGDKGFYCSKFNETQSMTLFVINGNDEMKIIDDSNFEYIVKGE